MINIGMALYGRSFTLKDPNMNDVGDAVIGAGQRGRYTREKGFVSYYEVKTIVALHCCNLLRVGICIDHVRTKCE
jgi:GH18 family chitinase